MSRHLAYLLLGVFALALATPLPAGDAFTLPQATVRVGERALRVEVAADELARRQGLMFREQLAAQRGMLFVWRTAAPRQIWMKIPSLIRPL